MFPFSPLLVWWQTSLSDRIFLVFFWQWMARGWIWSKPTRIYLTSRWYLSEVLTKRFNVFIITTFFRFFIKILSNISNILLLIIYLWRIVARESAAICFYNITNMRLLDQKSQKMMVYNHFQWGCKIKSWKNEGTTSEKWCYSIIFCDEAITSIIQ